VGLPGLVAELTETAEQWLGNEFCIDKQHLHHSKKCWVVSTQF